MSHSLYNISRSSFSFCTDHCCAFGNAAESFAEIAAAADEGNGEGMFFDVVKVVGGSEDFGFVYVVYAYCL